MIKKSDNKLLNELVKDCIVYRLTETEALKYIEMRYGSKLGLRTYKVRKANPIIIYHRAGDKEAVDYNTDPKLFEKEMKYLHDNNFRVITMKDLGFNTKSNYLYIKSQSEPLLSSGIASVSKDK
jgi:hypothetical protein